MATKVLPAESTGSASGVACVTARPFALSSNLMMRCAPSGSTRIPNSVRPRSRICARCASEIDAGRSDPRRGPRPQVESRHTIAIGHIRNARLASGGKTHGLGGLNLHDALHGRAARTQGQHLRAGGVEDEDLACRRDIKIDERDRFETVRHGKRFQRAAGRQLQLVQHSRAIVRRRADDPEISTFVVDLDRGNVAKPRGGCADKVHRMVGAVGDDHQLAPEPIANKESARDRIVGETAQRKTFARESGAAGQR